MDKQKRVSVRRASIFIILGAGLGLVVLVKSILAAQADLDVKIYIPFVSNGLPPSEELIDRALADGIIDEETALLYKVYANFGDPRLPVPYRGDDKELIDSLILDRAAESWNSLSPQTQDLLRPFFIPPAYEGSWAQALEQEYSKFVREQNLQNTTGLFLEPVPTILPKEGWKNLSRPNGKIKVWWREADAAGRANAEYILKLVEDEVWLKLTVLMGVEPPSDAGVIWDGNGGDGLYDIYIYDWPNDLFGGRNGRGVNISYLDQNGNPPSNYKAPSYVLIRPRGVIDEVIVHEMMHTFQKGYELLGTIDEYFWIIESTAVWAVDFVVVPGEMEHWRLEKFFFHPYDPLNTEDEKKAYSRYLFPFYLAGQDRWNASIVRKIWFNAQINTNSLQAVEDTLQQAGLGGFESVWPEFVLFNWNRDKWNFYEIWDKIKGGMVPQGVENTITGFDAKGGFNYIRLGSNNVYEFKLDAVVKHLAAKYYRFKFDDDNVQSAVILNPFWNGSTPYDKSMTIQLLYKVVNGDWQSQNIKNYPGKSFCRVDPAERLEEMVVIVSNYDWKNRNDNSLPELLSIPLKVNNGGCWPPVTQISISPNDITGGGASRGTVTLEQNAPPGGVRVFLSSDEPDVANVPGQVIVPEGSTNISFPIQSNPVFPDSYVFIYAHQIDQSSDVRAQLAVRASDLISLTIPSVLISDEGFTGNVVINGKAPAGGVVVYLHSSANMFVQPTVAIPAGEISVDFEGQALHVESEVTGQVTASFNGTILVKNTKILPK